MPENSLEFVNPTPSFQDWSSGGATAWNDRKRDAFNTWAQMYYPNAFQTAMLNYQNEYEKPINQMLRYQQAGLNPYSYQHTQSASGSQGAAPVPHYENQQLTQQKIQNAIKGASTLSEIMGAAKDIYDYISFGKDQSFYRTSLTKSQSDAASLEAQIKELELAWNSYWNTGQHFPDRDESGTLIVDPKKSPRAIYMAASTNRINMQIEQLDHMINFLYPSQEEANAARAALQEYQTAVLSGHNDAILNIHTGNDTADQILRMVAYWMYDNSSSFMNTIVRKR